MADIAKFKLETDSFRSVGKNLSRPECIIAESDGTLWISDDRAAVTRIRPDGSQELIGSMGGAPNGLAMAADGTIYVANIGHGAFYRLDQDGRHQVLLDTLNGKPVGSANFVYIDEKARFWLTVSTVTTPRSDALHNKIADGYVILMDEKGPRRVAEGILFANEVRIDREGRYLYLAETTAGHVSRYPLSPDGSLGKPEIFGPSPIFPGALIDGITFDADGNLWITEITRHALIVLTPQGNAHTVYDDPAGKTLFFPTSLTFGGSDLRTAYVGSLKLDHLMSFTAPVDGAPMYHWQRHTPRGRA
jgi:sugar lactone lactonase YvrE